LRSFGIALSTGFEFADYLCLKTTYRMTLSVRASTLGAIMRSICVAVSG
jgi:hypothetical protein